MSLSSIPASVIDLLQIEKLVQGGSGLGRANNRVIFVPYTIPGETVAVQVTREKKDYAEGVIHKLLTPSALRREPLCPVFQICGGCQLQHLPEEAQMRYKVEALNEAFSRLNQIKPVACLPPISSPKPFYYRTRARFKVKNGKIGFYEKRQHHLVPISNCPLLIPDLNKMLAFIADNLPLSSLEEVEIQGNDAQEILLILFGRTVALPQKFYERAEEALSPISLKGIVLYTDADRPGRGSRHKRGQDYLDYNGFGKRFKVSDRSFSQANPSIQPLLVNHLLEWMRPVLSNAVLELYSGVGNFTSAIAPHVKAVTAIEGNRWAAADARLNIAGLNNVEVISSSTEEEIKRIPMGGYEKIFLNPSRSGASPAVLQGLLHLLPTQILYLSCNPSTLVRDLRVLAGPHYQVTRIQPFDMFPQTGHLEVMAELVRQ